MSYEINKSDGSILTTVPENAIIEDASSLSLIGRGVTIYGEAHAENFVHLLENFANNDAPRNPLNGQLWFDTTLRVLRVYDNGTWNLVGSGSGSGGEGAGSVFIDINGRSALVLLANNKVIAVASDIDVVFEDLPESLFVLGVEISFSDRFPEGLEAGLNLATDAENYIFNGEVPFANSSGYAGGGDPLAANAFIDLGTKSLALNISNNVVVAAYSQDIVNNSELPINITIGDTTMELRSVFPNGLGAGLNLASNFGITLANGASISGAGFNDLITSVAAQALVDGEAQARADAVSGLETFANDTFATAQQFNSISAEFINSTGQTSLSEAISFIVASSIDGTSNASAVTMLRSEIENAITGATSFSDALSRIDTLVTTDFATSSELISLQSTLGSDIATATQGLATEVFVDQSIASSSATLTANFNSAIANITDDVITQATLDSAIAASTSSLNTQLGNLTSRVTLTENSLVDISGRTEAFWEIETNAGAGASAFIRARATTSGNNTTSNVSIGANEFTVFNTANGEYIRALDVSGGNVQIHGQLQANSVTADMLNIGSETGARTTIDTDLIQVFDENNQLRVRLGVFN